MGDIFLGGGEQKFSLNGDLIIWSMEKLGSAFFFFFGAEKYFWEGGNGKKDFGGTGLTNFHFW